MVQKDTKLLSSRNEPLPLLSVRFSLGWDEYMEVYHAETDRFFHKCGLFLIWPLGYYTFGCLRTIGDIVRHTGRYRGSIPVAYQMTAFAFCLFIFALVCVFRPPVPLLGRRAAARRFFALHGLALSDEDDPHAASVEVTVSLGSAGAEEVRADGLVVRVPYACMRHRPVLTENLFCLVVKNSERDSVLSNPGPVASAFRPTLVDLDIALPRARLRNARALRREVNGRIREASKRYKRACKLVRHARFHAAWNKERYKPGSTAGRLAAEARDLMAPELEWLEQGETNDAAGQEDVMGQKEA